MGESLITWNVANWITVLLMVIVGLSLAALASKAWSNRMAA